MIFFEGREGLLKRGQRGLEMLVVFHHVRVLRYQLEVEGEEVQVLFRSQYPDFLFSLPELLPDGLVCKTEFTERFDVVSKFGQS